MGAEPSPASFENTPRLTPQPMQVLSPTPPQTASGSNALTNMSRKTPGRAPAFAAMTARQARMYMTPISGTSSSHTRPSRPMPPERT